MCKPRTEGSIVPSGRSYLLRLFPPLRSGLLSNVPPGRTCLSTSNPALRTGLLSEVPSSFAPPSVEERKRPPGYGGQAGDEAPENILEPYVDADMRPRNRFRVCGTHSQPAPFDRPLHGTSKASIALSSFHIENNVPRVSVGRCRLELPGQFNFLAHLLPE